MGSRIASEFTVLRDAVAPSRVTGRAAAEDPLREVELLDETLRDNEVGDRLVHSLPAPPGVLPSADLARQRNLRTRVASAS